MKKYVVSLEKFRFLAFVPGGQQPAEDTPTPAEWLERRTEAASDERTRVTVGRSEYRSRLIVEAHSPGHAEGEFRRLCGISSTRGRFTVEELEVEAELVGAGASAEPGAPKARRAGKGARSADDVAREILGDRAPTEG